MQVDPRLIAATDRLERVTVLIARARRWVRVGKRLKLPPRLIKDLDELSGETRNLRIAIGLLVAADHAAAKILDLD
jgi:hypothetical protein